MYLIASVENKTKFANSLSRIQPLGSSKISSWTFFPKAIFVNHLLCFVRFATFSKLNTQIDECKFSKSRHLAVVASALSIN